MTEPRTSQARNRIGMYVLRGPSRAMFALGLVLGLTVGIYIERYFV